MFLRKPGIALIETIAKTVEKKYQQTLFKSVDKVIKQDTPKQELRSACCGNGCPNCPYGMAALDDVSGAELNHFKTNTR